MQYNTYQANNDYEMGAEHEHVLDDLEFELRTGTLGAVQIRSDLNKEDALKLVDNLRWLVERSY
jgi:hypothetical protein